MQARNRKKKRGRHLVAWVREQLGLTQWQLASLIGSTQPTVQSIELGRLALSERFAYLIAEQTGLDPQWLLANKLGDPPPDSATVRQGFEEAQEGRWKGIYAAHLLPQMIVLRYATLWLAVVKELGYTGSRAARVFKLLDKTSLELFEAIADSPKRKRLYKAARALAADDRQVLKALSDDITELKKHLHRRKESALPQPEPEISQG